MNVNDFLQMILVRIFDCGSKLQKVYNIDYSHLITQKKLKNGFGQLLRYMHHREVSLL